MNQKITTKQIRELIKQSEDGRITAELFQRFLEKQELVLVQEKEGVSILTKEQAAALLPTPLTDEEAIELLVERGGLTRRQAKSRVRKWRNYATTDFNYIGTIAWHMQEGFTLKQHAPLAGSCYKDLSYIQDWDILKDAPTEEKFVFWVPRLALGSTSETPKEMITHREALRNQYKLSKEHCKSFGTTSENFALVLAYYAQTGERTPLKYFYGASDSLRSDGDRLVVGSFDERGLSCNSWDDRRGNRRIGFWCRGGSEFESFRKLVF